MAKLKFYKKRRRLNIDTIKRIIVWAVEIGIVAVIAVIIGLSFGSGTKVIGDSMEPTINNESNVLINKIAYKFNSPGRFDVIVFEPKGSKKSHYYIKRVVGLPGEKVQIKNGYVYVNGEALDDPYGKVKIETAGLAETEVLLEENEFFVLGDNRNSGEDSRFESVGNVKKEHIVGKPWFVISPFSEIGFIK